MTRQQQLNNNKQHTHHLRTMAAANTHTANQTTSQPTTTTATQTTMSTVSTTPTYADNRPSLPLLAGPGIGAVRVFKGHWEVPGYRDCRYPQRLLLGLLRHATVARRILRRSLRLV
jgi:hypothetical protein